MAKKSAAKKTPSPATKKKTSSTPKKKRPLHFAPPAPFKFDGEAREFLKERNKMMREFFPPALTPLFQIAENFVDGVFMSKDDLHSVKEWVSMTASQDLTCRYSGDLIKKGDNIMCGIWLETMPPIVVTMKSWEEVKPKKKKD